MTRKYDSTIARIAGNILSGLAMHVYQRPDPFGDIEAAKWCVRMAREIVVQTERTEPLPHSDVQLERAELKATRP